MSTTSTISARNVLKARAERMLASRTAGRLARARVRDKRLILAYHGIRPSSVAPVGDGALFVDEKSFTTQLDVLREVADVAPLNEIDLPGDGRPRVAITFDDAYQGAVTIGVAALVKRGLPATIFVAPARLHGHVFWWDALAREALLDDMVREHAVNVLSGSDEAIRDWARDLSLPSCDTLPPYARSASMADLRAATRAPGITVASHSWSHANLAALDDASLRMETEWPLEWLRAQFGDRAIPWLAYPYGLESPAARRAAERAAYEGAVCILGGWHRPGEVSRYARPRLHVPAGLSAAGLRARLTGAWMG